MKYSTLISVMLFAAFTSMSHARNVNIAPMPTAPAPTVGSGTVPWADSHSGYIFR